MFLSPGSTFLPSSCRHTIKSSTLQEIKAHRGSKHGAHSLGIHNGDFLGKVSSPCQDQLIWPTAPFLAYSEPRSPRVMRYPLTSHPKPTRRLLESSTAHLRWPVTVLERLNRRFRSYSTRARQHKGDVARRVGGEGGEASNRRKQSVWKGESIAFTSYLGSTRVYRNIRGSRDTGRNDGIEKRSRRGANGHTAQK